MSASQAAATPSRREVLNYAFGASIALMLAGSCGGLVWFSQQQIKYDVYGGIFKIDPAILPTVNQTPAMLPNAFCWLAHTDLGLLALDVHCTFREHWLFKWAESNHRFECPSCGSKFRLDGSWIEDIAPRDLDRYAIEVRTANGVRTTPPNGDPVSIEGAKEILIYANNKILGKPHSGNAYS